MTYLEIIEWIEGNSCEVWSYNNAINLEYYPADSDNGERTIVIGKDLISIVLGINNKEIIK